MTLEGSGPGKKVLPVLDNEGQLRSDIREFLFAQMAIPEDPESRDQALLVASHEKHRFEVLGEKSWTPTSFSQNLLTRFEGQTSNRFTAGMCAISMYLLVQRDGAAASVNKAKVATREALLRWRQEEGNHKVIYAAYHEAGNLIKKPLSIAFDAREIDRAWREYASVSHLLAADIVRTDHFGHKHAFLTPISEIGCMLETARLFLDATQAAFSRSKEDSWMRGVTLWELPDLPPFFRPPLTDPLVQSAPVFPQKHWERVVFGGEN